MANYLPMMKQRKFSVLIIPNKTADCLFRFALMILFTAACLGSLDHVCADPLDVKLVQCWSCHGEAGRSSDSSIPVIWGQNASYIVKQLSDYREGTRDSQIMSSMAESIARDLMPELAARIEQRSWPALSNASSSMPSSASLQTCMTCHGDDLKGAASPIGYAPRLAGQNEAYLVDQMQAFNGGVRSNQAAMTNLMQNLGLDEQKKLAHEISQLP